MSSGNEPQILQSEEQPEAGCNCPKCGVVVHRLANRCQECGEFFPNLEQRVGNPWGGAMCGLFRGIGLIGFVVAGAAGIRLLVDRGGLGNIVTLLIGILVFSTCLTIAGRLDKWTYRTR